MYVDFEEVQRSDQKRAIWTNLDSSRVNVSVRLFSEDNRELSNAPIVVMLLFVILYVFYSVTRYDKSRSIGATLS